MSHVHLYIFSYKTFVKLTLKTYVVHYHSDNTVLVSFEDTSTPTVRENIEYTSASVISHHRAAKRSLVGIPLSARLSNNFFDRNLGPVSETNSEV